MLTPQQRYLSDPTFNRVVNYFEKLIHEAQLTPSEIREAAMLACIHYEEKTVRHVWFGPDKGEK